MPRITPLSALHCLAPAALCLHGSTAQAHPHVFVDARAGFVVEGGTLQALRIEWRYDLLTSLYMFEILDLDRDGDGALDDEDRAAIVAGETEWEPGYDGDIHLTLHGAPVAMGQPEDGSAMLIEDQVVVRFTLPLAQPLNVPPGDDGDRNGDGIVLRLFDPIFYYAYTIVEGTDAPALPPGCASRITPFTPDEASEALRARLAALSREEIPEDENVGSLFADRVTLECSGVSG